MTDYLTSVIAGYEKRHGNKPSGVVVGLTAAIALARNKELWPEVAGVTVVTRPLAAADRPVEPGKGSQVCVSLGIDGMEVFELA